MLNWHYCGQKAQNICQILHTHIIEKHLILEKEKLPDKKPADVIKHKKGKYTLFKAGYVTKIWVKSNIKKGEDFPFFLVRCQVNTEMKKQDYEVYLHLNQVTGDVVHAKCQSPAGTSGRCKHVATISFQLLDFCELELSQGSDEKSCAEELQQ